MYIKHNNIIDYIYYICNLIQGKVGFEYSTTLAHGIPSPKHPKAPKLRTPIVPKTTRKLKHLVTVYSLSSLVSGLSRSRGFNLHF
jgi:hypothetical protein